MSHLQEFAPNLYLTETQVEDFDVRGVVIIGGKRSVVWDTLSHPRDMLPVLPLLADKYTMIVYSHADWDHIWGTAALPHHEIIGHKKCYERFFADVPTYLQDKKAEQPGKWDEVVLAAPTMTFSGQMNLDLGGVTLQLHHLAGHTLDCCVGFIPEWGVLLAGDTVETPLPIVEEDSPMDVWLQELERWEKDERVKTVIPSHGPISDRSLITRNIAYLKGLFDGSAKDLLPAVMTQFYWDTHEQNLRYAQQKKP
ncbi:MAG: MBL fold metallo-hydrolase [Anaerolineae bacterium]